MNLNYVKDYLTTRKENISTKDVEQLLTEINSYQGTESTFTDISKVMRTINEYNISFLTKVQEYEATPKEGAVSIPKRMEIVRGILTTLSMLHTYLVLSVSNVKESTFDMKNIRTYIADLNEKKEHFKSEKMTWGVVLKSLIQEADYTIEIKRLDIERQLGYLKKS